MEKNRVKAMTRLGLMLMSSEARNERLDALIDNTTNGTITVNCNEVARLIDEARDAIYVLTDQESETVDEQEKIKIRWMLTKVKGASVVRNMNEKELAAWVADLRENKTICSTEDLKTVAKAMMRRE